MLYRVVCKEPTQECVCRITNNCSTNRTVPEIWIVVQALVVTFFVVLEDDVHTVAWLLCVNLQVVQVEELRHLKVRVIAVEVEITASCRRIFFILAVSARETNGLA